MKANYREHLSDPSRFREVVPIRDGPTLTKIHQTYRLQYLKDVILARIIDDPTFSMLNSFIFFHQVDIVQHLQNDEAFLNELFSIFETPEAPLAAPPAVTAAAAEPKLPIIGPRLPSTAVLIGPTLPPSTETKEPASTADGPRELPKLTKEQHDKQHAAILLLQQFCSLAKNLQIAARNQFYRLMGERGLLRVLECALVRTSSFIQKAQGLLVPDLCVETEAEEEQSIRVATIEILMMVIDHNPNGVRSYCLKQDSQGKRTLVQFLIELLLSERDLGVQAQMAEAIKVLVQSGPDNAGVLEVCSSALWVLKLYTDPKTQAMRSRPEDPEAERFLQYFYDHCVAGLFKPITDLPSSKSPAGKSCIT